jgi:hypothetical protein
VFLETDVELIICEFIPSRLVHWWCHYQLWLNRSAPKGCLKSTTSAGPVARPLRLRPVPASLHRSIL